MNFSGVSGAPDRLQSSFEVPGIHWGRRQLKDIIVVAGSLAQKPGYGGHTWVFLQYLLGLRRLGWDVVFVDCLAPEMCIDEGGQRSPLERAWNVRYLRDVMERFAFANDWTLLYNGLTVVGISRRRLLECVRQAAALFNIMGFLDDEEILAAATTKVFLDIDPGFPQMWHQLGLAEPFRRHTHFVTIGENIGATECSIPTCGLKWNTTVQPIVLEHWPVSCTNGRAFTSVASWRGAHGPLEYRGKRYGLRVHEFRSFAELPRETGRRFEIALDIHPGDRADRELLEENGWLLVAPRKVAGDPWSYRRYIQSSAAEFAVAKSMYVQSWSGWFSDRSICYLASGKPVLVQDTGFRHLGLGDGLLTFSTIDEAAAGAAEICGNYSRHSRAARELAEDRFDSDRVLGELLAKLGLA